MLFNSPEFLLFLPAVFLAYWLLGRGRRWSQNLITLIASYFFYGWWDWHFLGLLFFSTSSDYLIGRALSQADTAGRRRFLLATSVLVNLGVLGYFKYSDFFAESFARAFATVGIEMSPLTLNLILPIGISFYTFQTLSYTIDVYRKNNAYGDYLTFLTYVSFFPQLVAGPIERAGRLLPQFQKARRFDPDVARDGLRQMLWGAFKKVVIADTCAGYVGQVFIGFDASSSLPGSMVLLALVYFAFQIYGDFSGYSDIAIGTAKLFGVRLSTNFSVPYFSRNVGEFWQRWHISLSTWFRDYVYIPLGGNRQGKAAQIRNSIITFTVSGFWHGANWTFIAWGFINGLYYLPQIVRGRKADSEVVAAGRSLPTPSELLAMVATFCLILISWAFFRAESMSQAVALISRIFSMSLFSPPPGSYLQGFPLIGLLLVIEWVQRTKSHGLEMSTVPVTVRWPIYLVLTISILALFQGEQAFIYFQF